MEIEMNPNLKLKLDELRNDASLNDFLNVFEMVIGN